MRLFRDQALEAHRERLQGDVVLTPPPVGLLLTAGLVVVAVGVGTSLLLFDYARKETVPGFVSPSEGMARIVAPAAGVVAEVLVYEGADVQKDDPLVRLTHFHRDGTGHDPGPATQEAIEKRITSVHERIDVAKQTFIVETKRVSTEHTAISDERIALTTRIEAQQELFLLAKKSRERRAELAARGVISEQDLLEAESALTRQRLAAAELAQQAAVLDGKLSALDKALEYASLVERRTVAELNAELRSLEQELAQLAARRETLLTAPLDGVVAALTAAPGEDAAAGRAMLQILPDGASFEAVLFVPSRAIGFVAVGQSVRIRYDAFPYERFGVFSGEVQAVTRTVLAPQDAPPHLPLNQPAYRVVVTLSHQTVENEGYIAPLQAGMSLQASIVLESRSLLQWLLAPIMKMTGSLT